MAGLCALINLYAPQAILPLLAVQFRASPAQVAGTISATTLAVAIFAPFVGALADRLGRKRMILAGLVGLAVPTLLSGLASTLNQLILTRFLQGMVVPAVFTASLGYVGEEWERSAVGRTMSLYVAATVLGGFLGRFVVGLAAEYADWHRAFFLLASINLLGAAIVWQCLPPPRRASRPAEWHQMLRGMAAHLRNRRLLSAYLVGFSVLFSLVTLFTYVNFHLAAPPFGLTPGALGLVFCVYLVGIVVTPFSGQAIERFGQSRVLLLAAALAAIGAALTLVPALPLIMLGLCLFSSAIFVSHASATSYIGLVSGANRSSAAGLYLTFYYIGGGLGALLPGLLWTRFGWPACVGLAIAAQAVVALVAIRLWR
jgi:predicted MFS family arabinose efflux permease